VLDGIEGKQGAVASIRARAVLSSFFAWAIDRGHRTIYAASTLSGNAGAEWFKSILQLLHALQRQPLPGHPLPGRGAKSEMRRCRSRCFSLTARARKVLHGGRLKLRTDNFAPAATAAPLDLYPPAPEAKIPPKKNIPGSVSCAFLYLDTFTSDSAKQIF
jgi:hypothetical protein